MDRHMLDVSSSDSESSGSAEDTGYDREPEVIRIPAGPSLARCLARDEERKSTSRVEHELRGKDQQGVDWNAYPRTKTEIRETRLRSYENYLNHPDVFYQRWPEVRASANNVQTGTDFFQYHSFTSNRSLSVLHFQLRNLLWATTGFDFYYLSDNCINLYNTLVQETEEILNLRGGSHSAAPNLGSVLISTICASHDLLAAGGFHGELVLSDLQGNVRGSKVMTTMDSGITNGLEIYEAASGAAQIVASNNDNMVRLVSAEHLKVLSTFEMPWPANWTAPSPFGGKLLAMMGDDPVGLLLDSTSGTTVARLRGHLDFSFAAAWHPSGVYLATGNQDTSTRIWDTRKLDQSLHMLAGDMCAVRSLRYSPCGRFLAASEAADFVNLYDHASSYSRAQKIEFFSEVAGITFTPDGSSFMVGLQENRHGGFLQYQRSAGEVQRRMVS